MDELENTLVLIKHWFVKAAIAYASAPNAMSFHGLGVTEHSQGTYTVMLIADLSNDNR
jgi:formate dehydrogenase major subunit